jgi:hypothetical protein
MRGGRLIWRCPEFFKVEVSMATEMAGNILDLESKTFGQRNLSHGG